MTTEPNLIVVQHLRAIRTQLDTLNDRVLELTQRVGNSEGEHFSRIDRVDARLDRVERRIGLIEA
jgi:hypothetical protein